MEEDFDTVLEQLMSILGRNASLLEARQLLLCANGNLQHALNLHCDRTASVGPLDTPHTRRNTLSQYDMRFI